MSRISAIRSGFLTSAAGILFAVAMSGCAQVDDDRIPLMPAFINLSDAGMWNTYGVSGFGIFRYFILYPGINSPNGYHYTRTECTGFGGVLLIGGMDPFTNDTNVPLAYDLACPVERLQTVRVAIDPETFQAVCPECHSHYDVTMAGGSPLSGPAFTGKRKYGLRRFKVIPSGQGGYVITN